MTPAAAVAFIRNQGVVLESGAGPVPSLSTAIAGAPIRGSWWAHPRRREIFALTRAVRDCKDVLVCRLVDGKITFVHRRLWPALVRASRNFPRARLARIRELHTASGKHIVQEVGYPEWVPPEVAARAAKLEPASALSLLGDWHRPRTSRQRRKRQSV